MADIGIRTDSDTLVLWRGRDFKWTFENLDKDENPVDFPPGRLFFELQTGGEHNAVQRVSVKRATGGTYKLGVFGQMSPAIDYDDVSQNPQGLPGDITDALEAIPAVGPSNVYVAPAAFYPYWILNFNLNSGWPLSEQTVNVINKTANDFFNQFDSLLGVDITMTVQSNLNFQLQVTALRAFDEVSLVTWAINITSTMVRNFFNAVSGLVGAINTVNVNFYWNRVYEVEFIGDLAYTAIPKMTVSSSSLTGNNAAVEVEVLAPGKHPLTVWDFLIENHRATIKVESEDTDLVAARTKWQLVFLPDGEPAGGDPVTQGTVQRLGE